MTRSLALVARFDFIGVNRSRDPKCKLLIGSCIVEGAVIGTLYNGKFNTSEKRFFTERIDTGRNQVFCYRVPSIDLRDFCTLSILHVSFKERDLPKFQMSSGNSQLCSDEMRYIF